MANARFITVDTTTPALRAVEKMRAAIAAWDAGTASVQDLASAGRAAITAQQTIRKSLNIPVRRRSW